MIYTILLQGTTQSSGSGWSTLIIMIAMFAIFYFLMVVPQQKKQKEHQRMLEALQVNDRVITSSGMYGRIVTIKPDKNSIVLEVDDTNHLRIEFQRSAIAALAKQTETQA